MGAQSAPVFRTVLAVVGLVATLAPRRLIDAAERLALENPDACELKPWVVPAARIEGVAYLVLAGRGDVTYSVFKKSLGVIGLFALSAPRALVDSATGLAYADADACRWKPWVYPFARLVGVCYVLVALDELRRS